jgi:nucleotide-binding universal stress UspA family protein
MKQLTYSRLLLTHDGSKLASGALPHVKTLALAFKAEVLLLQVVDSTLQFSVPNIAVSQYSTGIIPFNDSQQIIKIEKNTAVKNLNKLKKELESQGLLQISTKIAEGNAGDEIVKEAKSNKCDLIIMATHGRSGVVRVLLGSVADQVTKHAPCPVLLVRPEEN